MSKLLIRVDDFPGTKPEEFWRHNLDNFKKFDFILGSYVSDYTIGVIPRHTTQEQIDWLVESNRIWVALHGINHDERFPNEFGDHLTEDDIYQAIMSAKAPLDVCNPGGVTTYIPPHNVIDRKTVNALDRAGFKDVYVGPETDPEVIEYASRKMVVTSHMPPLNYGRSDELFTRGAVEHLRRQIKTDGSAVLCLHWPWEWNIGLQNLDKFLEQVLAF